MTASATDDHSHGLPDEALVVIITAAAVGLVGLCVALALLTKMWMGQAEPSMLHTEPPAPVEAAH